MLYLPHPILCGKSGGSGSPKCRPLLPQLFVRHCLPARVAPPHTSIFSVPEPLGSAYPFGSKSNTSYVPLTRKGPKCKVLVYYLPSWQTQPTIFNHEHILRCHNVPGIILDVRDKNMKKTVCPSGVPGKLWHNVSYMLLVLMGTPGTHAPGRRPEKNCSQF